MGGSIDEDHLRVNHGLRTVDPLKLGLVAAAAQPRPVVNHGLRTVDPLKR